jgi:hypothetical protein
MYHTVFFTFCYELSTEPIFRLSWVLFVVQNYFQARWHNPILVISRKHHQHMQKHTQTFSLSLSLTLSSRATPLRTVSMKSASPINISGLYKLIGHKARTETETEAQTELLVRSLLTNEKGQTGNCSGERPSNIVSYDISEHKQL